MDFFRVCKKESRKKDGPVEVYADYIVGRSKDLMVQGGAFYAVWDEEQGLWSRNAYDVQILVDREIQKELEKLTEAGIPCEPRFLQSFDSDRWNKFVKYCKTMPDNSHPLDMKVAFSNSGATKRTDYVSRRLPYPLAQCDISAYEELVSLLYTPEERKKFEWAIGAIISGDAKKIQKFLVFFGDKGTGKSTIMDIISILFGGKVKDGGYVAYFDAQALTGNTNAFATEAFKDNPLVAIQHDGDLSKIETNARLNSVVSHEDMKVNEKYKAQYDTKINAFLFMGTNKPVQITDAKSGLIRRLIDVNPTGMTHDIDSYQTLMDRIPFELGGIAHHCLQVYKDAGGKNAYSDYEPKNMMLQTDVFYNYVQEHHDIFKDKDGITLTQAWELYKAFCDESELPFKMTRIKFREELRNYFEKFEQRALFEGVQARSVYLGFKGQKFKVTVEKPKENQKIYSLAMDETESILDEMYAGVPAQLANAEGSPKLYWDDSERMNKDTGEMFVPKPSQIVSTVLGDIDTSQLHFVKVPSHHVVIDFDLRDENGDKSLELNMAAAASFPPTYAEISKSGQGVHLHYIYDGDTTKLSNKYAEGIEVKTFHGNASLRRRLTRCNNVSVATITGGLHLKEKANMQTGTLKTEQGLRKMIVKNLQKEIHPGTKPSIDFIELLLKEANASGMTYDVSDMRSMITAFAANSTNQAPYCLKAVARMEFKSTIAPEEAEKFNEIVRNEEDRIVFFDCEVYPNLFVVCWKYQGSPSVVQMIDPTPTEIENLVKRFKLVGYNNRSYDNHILWGRMLGMNNEELYRLSQRIIVEKDDSARFGGAWSASYADVYDFASVKQTLKKWEIELGIKHLEMDIPWDKPVPEEKISKVVEYCCNDVNALEAVFDACKDDFQARQILANMSGLTVNHSTRQHAIRIMFGEDKEPQKKFVYTDLSEEFPGYKFDKYSKTEKSTYRGEVVGEGGYVYAEPGIHENVALLDVASMHPTSIIRLNLFGPYTKNFVKLVEARLAIKHGNFIKAAELLPGVHVDETNAKALSRALKLVINSIYGYTCAKFANPFRDPRNIDNIVAKRGALFMIDLKHYVQELGFTVAHIKTDSIKIPDANEFIIQKVMEFGEKYGYSFEHEATYEKMCLVNDAVYIAKVDGTGPDDFPYWTATGAEFQHPYVFKGLFSHEPITFRDMCETKQVKEGVMYLRFNGVQKEIGEPKEEVLSDELADADPAYNDTHIGRSGLFVPINPNQDTFKGGKLLRIKDGKEYAVAGTKDYIWAEAETIRGLVADLGNENAIKFEDLVDSVEGTGSIADILDMSYYNQLLEDAAQSIEEFGSFEEFVK